MTELQPFRVVTTEIDEVTVVCVSGYLDLATSPSLRRAAQAAVSAGARRLVVDLHDTEFIDSTGLGVIVALHKRLPHGFAVVTSDNPVRRLFELTALNTVLSLHESAVAAVAAVAAPRQVTLPDALQQTVPTQRDAAPVEVTPPAHG